MAKLEIWQIHNPFRNVIFLPSKMEKNSLWQCLFLFSLHFFYIPYQMAFFAISISVIILEEIALVPYFLLLIAPPDFQTFHRFYSLFQGGEKGF